MKTMRSYKLSDTCLKQISWLRISLGLNSDTAVLEHSVSELYHRKQAEFREFLVPTGRGFKLMIGQVPVAKVSSELANSLPKDYLDRKGSKQGTMLAMLFLALAREGKGTMEIDRDALASIWGAQSPVKGKPSGK
jgi:hypothetical protein